MTNEMSLEEMNQKLCDDFDAANTGDYNDMCKHAGRLSEVVYQYYKKFGAITWDPTDLTHILMPRLRAVSDLYYMKEALNAVYGSRAVSAKKRREIHRSVLHK
jgi:hypothetical protein